MARMAATDGHHLFLDWICKILLTDSVERVKLYPESSADRGVSGPSCFPVVLTREKCQALDMSVSSLFYANLSPKSYCQSLELSSK